MSFRCGFCREIQPPGTKAIRIVTKIREMGDPIVKLIGDTIADYCQPREIVEEKMACPACAINHKGIKPEVVERRSLATVVKGHR